MPEVATPNLPEPLLNLFAARAAAQEKANAEPVADPPCSGITIDRCTLCGMKHENVALIEYQLPGKYSHWYVCTNADGPVGIKIFAGASNPLDDELMNVLAKAHESKQYLAAVFYVTGRDEKNFPVYQRYWRREAFPAGLVPDCAAWLRDDFAEKCGPPPVKELKHAELSPTIPMFQKRGVQKTQTSTAKVVQLVPPVHERRLGDELEVLKRLEDANAEAEAAQAHDDQDDEAGA